MTIQKKGSEYDVVIIGAGMVGACFALALQQGLPEGARVLVIEAAEVDAGRPASPSFDDRSTALSYGSSKILAQIGLWQDLENQAKPIRRIHVSDRGHFGAARLDSSAEAVPALGYVVENRRFGHLLNRALHAVPALELLAPARVEEISPVASGMRLSIARKDEPPAQVQAKLVVLADGGRSPICSQLGIELHKTRYDQQAIIANIAFSKAHGNVAYERFTESGPLAILPLGDLEGEHRGALVWTVSGSEVETLLQLAEDQLKAMLQERFGYRLGAITRIGERFCYPLSLQVAREQIRPGLVLLGNVAHTLHPVAGQGFNLALRDAAELAALLRSAIVDGQSPGDLSVLQAFMARQQGDQTRTINFSHYLTRLFSSDRGSLIWARKFGLASIDLIPLVKHEFARGAMGLADR